LKATVSEGATGSSFRIYMGKTAITSRTLFPQTASWTTYTQVAGKTSIALPAGTYQIRIAIEGGGCNIDKVAFTAETTGVNDLQADKFNGIYEVFTIMGISRGVVDISNGNLSTLKGKYPNGVYILRKQDGSEESKRILLN